MGKFCTNCGKPVTGNFCTNCGAPTQSEAPAQTTIEDASRQTLPTTLNGVKVDIDYLLIEFRTKSGIDKIGLIKKVRELTGAGLAESKDFVDAHCARKGSKDIPLTSHVQVRDGKGRYTSSFKDIPHTSRVQEMHFPPIQERKLSEKTGFIVLMLVLFWPVGLYLVFANKHYSKSTKLSVLGFFIAFLAIGFICAGNQT